MRPLRLVLVLVHVLVLVLLLDLDDVALDTRTYVSTPCNAPAATGTYNGTDVGTPRAVHTAECP